MDYEQFKKYFTSGVNGYLADEAISRNGDPEYAAIGQRNGIIQAEAEGKAPAIMVITDLTDYGSILKNVGKMAEVTAKELPGPYQMTWSIVPGWMSDVTISEGLPVGHGQTSEVFIASGTTIDGQYRIAAVYKIENDQTGKFWAPHQIDIPLDNSIMPNLVDMFAQSYRAIRALLN